MKLSFVLPLVFAALAVSAPIEPKNANNEIEARNNRGCLVCFLLFSTTKALFSLVLESFSVPRYYVNKA